MNFTILDEAVMISALTWYIEFCESCLKLPNNQTQSSFITGDIAISKRLLNHFREDYLLQGGNLNDL